MTAAATLLGPYRNLKVDQLVGESRDGVVEAEAVLSTQCRREDVIALTLLLAVENDPLLAGLFRGSGDDVVNCTSVSAPMRF